MLLSKKQIRIQGLSLIAFQLVFLEVIFKCLTPKALNCVFFGNITNLNSLL